MKYLIIFLLFPLKLFSQDLTGLWAGSLYNDTTQQTIQYEVAISESGGKFTAYSYTTFIVDGKEAVGVKSVKIVPQKDHFFFEDINLVYNNYPVPPPKGVKQISSVTFSETDSMKILSGKFITTRTKQYGLQVTGTVHLQRKKEIKQDKLVAVLDNLGLSNTLSFLPAKTIAASATKPVEKAIPVVTLPAIPRPKDPLQDLAKRTIQTIETVFFNSDSLTLQLYDNGYVDGDSVSIIVNGQLVLSHQRLSTQAITKTIPSTGDSLKIIMYAENLGTIAPNTGLLIIYDGDKRHEIRFEGDLEKNAAILLKRQRK